MNAQPRTTVVPDRWVQHVSALLLVLGVVGAVWGVVYAVNGMTQAGASVKVGVQVIGEPRAITVEPAWSPVEVAGVDLDPEVAWFAATAPGLLMSAWDSTRLEQLLNRLGVLVQGVLVLGGVVALRPVLTSIAHGRPFEPGNSRRLSRVALAIALMPLASLPPVAAATLVIARLDLADVLEPSGGLDATPLIVAALVMVVAAAFRNGERMTRDLDGLV